jgi:hypothetical protein
MQETPMLREPMTQSGLCAPLAKRHVLIAFGHIRGNGSSVHNNTVSLHQNDRFYSSTRNMPLLRSDFGLPGGKFRGA